MGNICVGWMAETACPSVLFTGYGGLDEWSSSESGFRCSTDRHISEMKILMGRARAKVNYHWPFISLEGDYSEAKVL